MTEERVMHMQGPALAFPRQHAPAAPRISTSSYPHHQLRRAITTLLSIIIIIIASRCSAGWHHPQLFFSSESRTHLSPLLSVNHVGEGAPRVRCTRSGTPGAGSTLFETSSGRQTICHCCYSIADHLWTPSRYLRHLEMLTCTPRLTRASRL